MNAHGIARWAALLLLVAAAQPSNAQEGRQVAEGARVYGSTCGRCHNARSPLEREDRAWVTIMNHMRVRANLTGDELRDVLAFLQATNTDPREVAPLPPEAAAAQIQELAGPAIEPSTDPAVIAEGEALIQQRACLGCHVVGKAGGQVGPTLNGVVRRRGADFVRRKLANPTIDNSSSMMPNFGLGLEEIEAITAYLATLNGR